MRSATAILAILLLTASSAFATIHYVKPDGSGDFPTIQDALDGASSFDWIVVADGTYTVANLTFRGKSVSLMSENGFADCHLQVGIGGGHVFLIDNLEGPGSLVDGFDIRNGKATDGGAVYILDSSPTFVNNRFRNNYAENRGGAVFITGSTGRPRFYNNIFDENLAEKEGGGLYLDAGQLIMQNNTVVFNEAPTGSGMHFGSVADLIVTENIFWGNFPDGQVGGAVTGDFGYNLIEDWSGGGTNFDGHPYLASGPEGDFYLGSSSDARDAGGDLAEFFCYPAGRGTLCMDVMTTATNHLMDLGYVDVGFHYGPLQRTHFVPGDFATIQDALDAVYPGDTIQLQPMVYSGPGNRDLDFHGKPVTLRGDPENTADATIGCEGDPAEPHRGIHFNDGEGLDTVVEGLTIHGGYAAESGGGVLCEGSSPTFRNIEIIDCEAAVDGGGIACFDYSSPVIEGCIIGSNDAGDDGGGLVARNFSSPDIDDSHFSFNRAVNRGGGALFVVNSFPTIDGTRFYENSAAKGAGMMFTYAYGPVTDCLILSNWASEYGGGVQCYGNAQCEFTRCTIAKNHAAGGVGVWCRNNSSPSFQNTIIAFNYTNEAVGRYSDNCNPTFSCCDIYGNPGGDWVGFIAAQYMVDGNFSGDPYFCNHDVGDFRLDVASMCSAARNPACGQIGVFGVNCSVSSVEEVPVTAPASRLVGCFPNPFNPSTKVQYELAVAGTVDLRVYDLAGRLVRVIKAGDVEQPGRREAVWDGRDDQGRIAAAGVYVVRLEAGGSRDILRVALVK